MSGKIYLVGGGELRDGDTQLIDDEVLSLEVKGSTFVFLGFAAQDNANYAEAVTSVYGKKYTVVIPTEANGREFAIDALQSAAVIYIGGGSTEQLMRVFTKWGLFAHLHAAFARGAHIVGMSAGAQALSKWYIHEDTDIFELRKGWDVVPIGILVHANTGSFNKAKLLWSDYGMTYPLIAVGEGAAWRVSTLKPAKVGRGKVWTISANPKL